MLQPFKGSKDPDRISLGPLFPDTRIVAYAPLQQFFRFYPLILEGPAEVLEMLNDPVHQLTRMPRIPEIAFGQWYGCRPSDGKTIELHYDSFNQRWNTVQLLVNTLRRHFAQFCDLHVREISHLVVVQNHEPVKACWVPFPTDIPNGTRELVTSRKTFLC